MIQADKFEAQISSERFRRSLKTHCYGAPKLKCHGSVRFTGINGLARMFVARAIPTTYV